MPSSLPLLIRPETPADVQPIFDLTASAFATFAISGHTEQYVIEVLRAAAAWSDILAIMRALASSIQQGWVCRGCQRKPSSRWRSTETKRAER